MIRVQKAPVVLMAITLMFAGLLSNSHVSADDLGTLLRIDVYIKSDTDLRIVNTVVFVNESSVNREIRQYVTFIKGNVSIPLIQPKSLVKQNLILYISNRIPPGKYNISVYLRAMIGSQSKYITYSLTNLTTIITPMSERIASAQLYFTIRETDFTRKLEWTCPTPPSKYAPPTTSKPFNATLIYESVSPGQGLVYLLINDTLYDHQLFVTEFNLFIRDLLSSDYSVRAYLISGGTPSDLRSLLRDGLDEGLVGAILIGDLPVAWYEMYCWERWEQFPTDLFYMDLDGSFTDSDNDGLFDSHSDGEGDRAPEIWIGRLDVPNKYSDVEYEILAYYFYRHHLYITGEITVPHRALIYIDDDWVSMAESVDNSLAKIYSERILVTDEATTNSEDYKARLAEGYEWVHLQCHGWPGGHVFKVPSGWNGTVYTSDYEAIDPPVFFYQFFVCSGARFVENDYLAGSAVFKTSYGLAAIGSTKTGSMLYFSDFYTKLAERKSIGEAFKEWFILHGESSPCWFYGLTIIGSPVLTPRLERAKLYGWVKDLSGNAIEGATVEAYNYTSRELLNSSVTGAEGYYEMSVPYGNMYLIIHKNGYYTYSSDVFYNLALIERNATLTPILLEKKDVMLVVDDDAEYWVDQGTWPEEIRVAIERAGYDVYTWNESVQGLPSLEALKDAKAVFWHTGTRYHYAISELDAETLLQYVQGGGRLVLEGEDIGYDHRNDTFMQKVAHANYHVNIASGNLSMALPLHRITSGLPLNIRFEYNPPYPDGVSPVAGAFEVLQYESGYSAVIGYDNATNGGSRTIYISFPVHYLSKNIRDILIANSINWVIKRPVYLVVRGMNNRIYYNLMLDGSWSGWRVIPSGSTPDAPAAAICRNRLHIVVRGNDNGIWHGYIDLATESWSGWRRIPGSTPSAPTLAAEEDLYLYLVVRGSDNRIYVNKYDCVADEWLGWHKVLSGATPSSPAAAIRNDGENIHIFDIVVRGMNNGIWHGTINLNDWSFNGWHRVPGSTPSSPRLISTALFQPLYLAVRGMNNKIYINKFENDNWQGWEQVPTGTTPDAPSISSLDEILYLFVRGGSDGLWRNIKIGSSWSGWSRVSGSTPSAPISTVRHYRLLTNATLFDDFEDYAVGEFPSAGGWEVAESWGTYIAEVSRNYSYSGPQAFKLRNVAVHRKVFDDVGEMWRYVGFEASVIVTEVYIGGAHYDLCLMPSDPHKGPSLCVRLTVNDINGDGEYDICPGWGSECDSPEEVIESWSPNEWIRLRVLLDREEGRFYIWVNGTLHEEAFEPYDGNLYMCDWITMYSDELLSYTDDVRVFFLENRS